MRVHPGSRRHLPTHLFQRVEFSIFAAMKRLGMLRASVPTIMTADVLAALDEVRQHLAGYARGGCTLG